ncbi:hypothetical protein [Pseudomonas laurylsulfatiphila]|uniref:hypothetical protein n=1 Tax=Pseudomonas laurylsulfatiphila TaxID=2011015 RepID=UPI003D2267CF
MVINDNACDLDKRGALESIASKLAPTVSRGVRFLMPARRVWSAAQGAPNSIVQ